MRLIHRQTKITDLPACAELVRRSATVPPECDFDRLSAMWEHLLTTSAAISGVVVDRDADPEAVVGFGMSVCATNDLVEQAIAAREPYLTACVLTRWQSCSFPLLSYSQIRRANAGNEGVNVLGLHTIWSRPGMTDQQCAPIRDEMLRSLFAHHRGYRLKWFLKEVVGEEEIKRHEMFGCGVLNDYSGYYAYHRPAATHTRIALVGIDRPTALKPQHEGRYVRELFRFEPPICKFTRAQQELLQLALLGLTDSQIARVLNVEASAIRDRWDAVYARLPDRLNEDLQAAAESMEEPESRRFAANTRRRLLVNWLIHHPEELRPMLYIHKVDLVSDSVTA